MKHLAISVAILILPTALHAAQPAATPPAKQGGAIIGQQNSNAPIDISSDSFQADLNGKTGTWTAMSSLFRPTRSCVPTRSG